MEMNSKNLKDSSSIMRSLIIRINKEKMTIMEYQSEWSTCLKTAWLRSKEITMNLISEEKLS